MEERTIAHDNFICLLLLRQQYKFSHTWASDIANLFCFVVSSSAFVSGILKKSGVSLSVGMFVFEHGM
jgi:hypothetical protein